MRRKIVSIDESNCNGCGQCASACVEGALEIVNGKARLVSDVYCDGLGACLGECPMGAITIEEREALQFDEDAALHAKAAAPLHAAAAGRVCPGSALRTLERRRAPAAAGSSEPRSSRLSNWPVQLNLVPPAAPFLKGADLLISADCVAYALADFHERCLDGRVLLVGCPKLDDLPRYAEKLRAVFAVARPRSVRVLRMEVPCCGGLVRAVIDARDAAAPGLEISVETVSIDGGVLRSETV